MAETTSVSYEIEIRTQILNALATLQQIAANNAQAAQKIAELQGQIQQMFSTLELERQRTAAARQRTVMAWAITAGVTAVIVFIGTIRG